MEKIYETAWYCFVGFLVLVTSFSVICFSAVIAKATWTFMFAAGCMK